MKPNPQAAALAQEMLSKGDLMRQILDETIPGDGQVEIRESGRTLCGTSDDIRGPLARFPSAVDLASCPRGVNGGTWHTHVTKDELRNPHNSLPDTANVIFGQIDVSAVVGTQSTEVLMRSRDDDAAVRAFRDAIGVSVSGPDEVVDAILAGDIPDPTDARSRVRRRLGGLFERHKLNFNDLDRRLETSGIPAHSPASIEFHEAQLYSMLRHSGHGGKHPRNPAQVRSFCRNSNETLKKAAPDVDAKQVAATTAISEVVKRAFFP